MFLKLFGILSLVIIYLIYSDQVKFMSPKEMELIVTNDPYFKNMNKYDLIARHVNTESEYLQKYKSSLLIWSPQDKQIIKRIIQKANDILAPYKNINRISWKFAKINSNIEQGYAHTLYDTIIFNDYILYNTCELEQIRLAIHEKIHIYQRIYHKYTSHLFTMWNFVPIGNQYKKSRNNPDSDFIMYMYKGDTLTTEYNTENPTSIAEISNLKNGLPYSAGDIGLSPAVDEIDHPNEIMAYEICNILTGYPQSYLPHTIWWMNIYM